MIIKDKNNKKIYINDINDIDIIEEKLISNPDFAPDIPGHNFSQESSKDPFLSKCIIIMKSGNKKELSLSFDEVMDLIEKEKKK
jgi:hypothetical protein